MLFVQVAIPRSFGNLQRLTLLSLAHLGSPLLVVIAEDEDSGGFCRTGRDGGFGMGTGGTGGMRKGAASKCFLECFSPLCAVHSVHSAQCAQCLSTVHNVSFSPLCQSLIRPPTYFSFWPTPQFHQSDFCQSSVKKFSAGESKVIFARVNFPCPEVQFRGITRASSLGVSWVFIAVREWTSLGVSLSWMRSPVYSSFCRTYGCSIYRLNPCPGLSWTPKFHEIWGQLCPAKMFLILLDTKDSQKFTTVLCLCLINFYCLITWHWLCGNNYIMLQLLFFSSDFPPFFFSVFSLALKVIAPLNPEWNFIYRHLPLKRMERDF